jgi:hypothetical protein
MRMRTLCVLGILGLLALVGPARADYSYEFASNTSGNFTNTFNVGVGQTVNVYVYIQETTTSNLATYGLSAAGVQLNTTSPGVATVTGVTPNAAFNAGSSTGTGANAYVSEFSTSGVTAPSTGPTANAVLLGSFTFTGVTAGQTATVTALPGLNPDNVLNDGNNTVIDSYLANNATSAVITVTAVPEPGTMALSAFGMAAMGAAVWYRRRRCLRLR